MALTPTPSARGKALQPWTWWELLVIAVSAIMIGVPLMLEIARWTMPERVPAQTSSSVPTGNDLRLGLAGNWGSAYIGDVVRLTLATSNDHPDAAMSEVTVALTLPPSLELVGAEADRGSGVLSGPGAVSYGPFNLESGDTSRLTVDVRVAENAQSGTVLVTQGQASFSGADGDSFSNIVTVLVLGAAPTAPPTELPTATAEPTATVEPTAEPTVEPSATVEPTAEPSATVEPTAEPSAVGGTGAAPQSGATSRPATTEPSIAATAAGSVGNTTSAPAAATSAPAAATSAPAAAISAPAAATSAPAAATSAPAVPSPQAAGGVSQSDSAMVVPTPLLNPTSVPQATTGNQPIPVAAAPAGNQTQVAGTRLPETSAGIPLTGLLLLGGTLLTRTVRLHRARERI